MPWYNENLDSDFEEEFDRGIIQKAGFLIRSGLSDSML